MHARRPGLAHGMVPRMRRRAFHPLDPRSAGARFVLALTAGAVGFAIAAAFTSSLKLRGLVAWDAFAVVATSISLFIIVRSDAAETKRRSNAEDPGRVTLGVLGLVSAAVSLFAALVVMHDVRAMAHADSAIWLGLAIGAIVLSWILTHASYTLRYAHLHYADVKKPPLDFPHAGDEGPTDLDFAYFSFTIGMTFQTSDVAVQSAELRRTVLGHALLSFVYNTTIVGLTVSLVASLVG